MKKKIAAFLLASALTLSVVPAVAAEETQSDEETAAAVTTVEDDLSAEISVEAADQPAEESPAAQTVEEAPAEQPVEDAPQPVRTKAPVALAPTAQEEIPVITAVTPSAKGVKITWSAFSGAAKYFVYTKKTDGTWKKIGTSTALSFEHAFTPNNTAYTYTVRAADKNGKYVSSYDKTGYTFARLPAPKLKSLASAYKGLKFTWDAVKGADGYRVYLKDGKNWIALYDTSETSYIYEKAVSGKSYTFSVRCREKGTNAARSYFDHTGITATFYASPKLEAFTPVNGGNTVHWTTVKGAARYAVFAKTSADSNWKRLGYTTATSYNHTGLSANTVYAYAVRCADKNGKYISSYQSKNNTFRYLAPPEITGVTAVSGKPSLTWKGSEYIASYKIDRKTFDGSWDGVGKTAELTFTDTSAKASTLYTYAITGLDENDKKITRYIDTGIYYNNGAPASGKFKVSGMTLTFKNGKPVEGYVTAGKKTYYFGSDGKLKKNGIVGSAKTGYTLADKNGVCCISEEIKLAAKFMVKNCKGSTLQEKAKYGFMYLANNFPYNRTYDHPKKPADIAPLAIDMFKNRRGNCFRYAACFTCLAKIAGYRTRIVVGYTGGSPHGWNETLVNGKWLICDPDAQLPNYHKPAYRAYMMTSHYWPLSATFKSELVINENGKATWK